MGWGGPPPPSTLPPGPLPGETYDAYKRRLYYEQQGLEQQAEQRAYNDWQQAEARAYGAYQQADSRAYADFQQADNRAYGDFLSADNRAYGEARQQQGNREQAIRGTANLADQYAQNAISAARNQANLAQQKAAMMSRNRQPVGGITRLYRQTLGGY